jgi:hypothetical protein
MELETTDRGERQIDTFIAKRHNQRVKVEGPRPEHEIWQESEDRYNARRAREMRARWYGWHCDQAERHRRTLEALIAHHELEAEKLCEENGNGHKRGA